MRMKAFLALLVVSVSFLPRAAAGILTYNFEGTVSAILWGIDVPSVGPVSVGDPLSGSFSFETNWPNTSPTAPVRGSFLETVPPASFVWSLPGLTIHATSANTVSIDTDSQFDAFNLGVVNPALSVGWAVNGGLNPSFVNLHLFDTTGTALQSGELSDLPPLNLNLFSDVWGQFSIGVDGIGFMFPGGSSEIGATIYYELTSLTSIPEPSTLLLGILGSFPLAVLNRRLRRRTLIA